MIHSKSLRSGFSLLELLLAVAVFSTVMLAIFEILQNFMQKEQARATHKYMETVAAAMNQIMDDPENFNALYNAARITGGGYELIADSFAADANNITKNFDLGGVWIQGSRLFNNQFRPNSPLRTPIRILLRVADDPVNPNDTPALEMVIVTRDPRPETIVQLAANASGAHGGWIRNYAAKGGAIMESAFSSWRITPSAGLQSTNWYNNELLASLDTRNQGSYYVYYDYYNLADKTGDYLYRHPDLDTAGELNRMHGPLNMGGNDIIGADDVQINGPAIACDFNDDPGVTDTASGTLCVNGTNVVKGAAYVGGNMTAYGSVTVSDSAYLNAMRVQNAMNAAQKSTHGAQGLFVVDGVGNNSDEIVVNPVAVLGGDGNATFREGTTAGDGQAGNTDATTVTVPDGGTYRTNRITNTRRITATTTRANNLQVDHDLRVGEMTGGSMELWSARLGVIDVTNSENLIYGTSASPETLVAPRISVDRMSIGSFGTCNQGCGD